MSDYANEVISSCPDCGSDEVEPQGMECVSPHNLHEKTVCRGCGAEFEQTFAVVETVRTKAGEA